MSIATPPTPVPRKARRPRWLIGALLFFAAAPVGYFFVTNWLHQRELDALYREMDAEDPNWRYADLGAAMPKPPPDDQNAAVQFLRVRDLLVRTPFTLPAVPGKKTPQTRNSRIPADQATSIRAALAKLGPTVLEEARKLKDFPEGQFPFDAAANPFEHAKPPDLDPRLCAAMNLLNQDAMRRAYDGDFEGAAESCQALLHSAHAIGDYPALMAQLIRAAGQDSAVAAIERTLGQGQISAQRLAALQHALEREADHNAMYPAMRGERAWTQRYFELIEEGKIKRAGVVAALDPKQSWQGRMYILFPSLILRGHAEEMRTQNELVKASQQAEEARLNSLQAVAQKELDRPSLLPHIQGTAYLAGPAADLQLTQARLRCAATALAAERYRLEHGDWPENADVLVTAGLLKKSLKDPFDGQPLRWKKTPTGIVIHSLFRGNVAFELWRPEMRGHAAPPPSKK